MKIVTTLFLSTLVALCTQALTPEEEMAKMEAEFASYKSNQESEYKNYKESLEKEFSAYKKELQTYWKNPELSTKKEWVSYSDDKKSRSKVDFEKNVVVVEVIAENANAAQEKLTKRLAYAVTKDTKEVVKTDPLQKRIAQLSEKSTAKSSKVDSKPILETVIFKKKPTQKDVKNYAKKVMKENNIVVSKSDYGHQNVYKLTVPLPSNTRLKRAEVYKKDVLKNAKRFDIPVPLVFAIMQTESDFNPFAKSHIPAFGLMQIVPTSAGRDIHQFLYKKKGMPSATYLYNGGNNIEMGTSYLHILYYRYLKKIKNPESRLYCAIAAYNTGAGNIAWAYTKKYNMNKAAPLINAMTPDEVYNHLMSNLRFDEPKHYLKRVKKRMSAYKKAYKL
ncbi:MAG: transglycosylase SLT domain-containing protein [Campylobacterota bacterium]|nr:transglycosylase SLT domain-containing protein [Campylobacterota bacterium]